MELAIKKYGFIFGLVLFLGMIFTWNYSSFLGICYNTGYTNGKVIEVRKEGKRHHEYSVYFYTVDSTAYLGKQGGKYKLGSGYLIVFDKKNPRYSMIADYPYAVEDSLGNLNQIKPKMVSYSWSDYLPGF